MSSAPGQWLDVDEILGTLRTGRDDRRR